MCLWFSLEACLNKCECLSLPLWSAVLSIILRPVLNNSKTGPFVGLWRFVFAFVSQFLVNRIVYIVCQGGSATAVAGPGNKLFVEQMYLGQVIHVVFFSFVRLYILVKFDNFTNFMYFTASSTIYKYFHFSFVFLLFLLLLFLFLLWLFIFFYHFFYICTFFLPRFWLTVSRLFIDSFFLGLKNCCCCCCCCCCCFIFVMYCFNCLFSFARSW